MITLIFIMLNLLFIAMSFAPMLTENENSEGAL